MDINDWRTQIDEIDKRLVDLLNHRANCAIEIGKVKKNASLEAYDPARERWIFERIRTHNSGPLGGDALVRLFERIIDESRRLEREIIENS